MSLLDITINNTSPDQAKKLNFLLKIVQSLGWSSLVDNRSIKPKIDLCRSYIGINSKEIFILFPTLKDFSGLPDKQFINILNSILITYWQLQIDGNPDLAKLQLYIKNT